MTGWLGESMPPPARHSCLSTSTASTHTHTHACTHARTCSRLAALLPVSLAEAAEADAAVPMLPWFRLLVKAPYDCACCWRLAPPDASLNQAARALLSGLRWPATKGDSSSARAAALAPPRPPLLLLPDMAGRSLCTACVPAVPVPVHGV